MSFCSSPERKTTFLPGSGFGALVGPSQVVCGPGVFGDGGLGVGDGVGVGRARQEEGDGPEGGACRQLFDL